MLAAADLRVRELWEKQKTKITYSEASGWGILPMSNGTPHVVDPYEFRVITTDLPFQIMMSTPDVWGAGAPQDHLFEGA